MPIYRLTEGSKAPQTLGKRFRYALGFAISWLLAFSTLKRFANGHWDPPFALVAEGGIFFLGVLFTSLLWSRETQSLDLEIDDDGIRCLWNGKVVRRVRRNRVRYVCERRGVFGTKLVVSEHRFLMARLHRVNVPQRLLEREQYERIKAQSLNWLKTADE